MTERRFEVLWSEVAVRDLDRIIDPIERDAPGAAQRIFDQIKKSSENLSTLPLRGRSVPELARFESTSYRELLIPPYRLLYRVGESIVLVVAVFDGRRDLESVVLSRLLGGY
ncbi:MAG TPA: type II toxin-antitoxin system RelE/ParE family toxin [Thermoanaerobaculia bacterium]|nr:type II toxin-antitoxin system RelE/ParE family toxin [Thermoanaerobaculia bacterium]